MSVADEEMEMLKTELQERIGHTEYHLIGSRHGYDEIRFADIDEIFRNQLTIMRLLNKLVGDNVSERKN